MSQISIENANKDVLPLNWDSKPVPFFNFESAVHWRHPI